MRVLFLALSILLPWPLRRVAYVGLLHWEIAVDARIGVSYVDVRHLSLGPRARIGHFNVFRKMRRVTMASDSRLGQWNWISCAPMFLSAEAVTDRTGCLTVGRDASITSRHYLDCSGGLEIGEYATIAGVRTTILTHQIDLTANTQGTARVCVGAYAFVSSNCILSPGAIVPQSSIVAIGSVVERELTQTHAVYAAPAIRVVGVTSASGYFTREKGYVTTRGPGDEDQGHA